MIDGFASHLLSGNWDTSLLIDATTSGRQEVYSTHPDIPEPG